MVILPYTRDKAKRLWHNPPNQPNEMSRYAGGAMQIMAMGSASASQPYQRPCTGVSGGSA
jgi:hypothetical protein